MTKQLKRKIALSIVVCTFSLFIALALMFIGMRVYAENNNSDGLSVNSNNRVQIVFNNKEEKAQYFMDDLQANGKLSDVKYIPNNYYFRGNLDYARQNSSYNSGGTCTTVAMSMLMGYHNYYSDRRLIPASGENNRAFLKQSFADPAGNPIFKKEKAYGIGTAVGVYDELYDLNFVGGVSGVGQNVFSVARAAEKFVQKYAPMIESNVYIDADNFSDSVAQDYIDAGLPIILCFSPLTADADSYHVLVAYGYAKVDGVPGYIVHYGWDSDSKHCWVPTSWISYQICMRVSHKHNWIDTGNNVNEEFGCITYRETICSECGCNTVEDLYATDNNLNEISGVNFPVSSTVQIPLKVHGNRITRIGDGAFAGSDIETLELQNNIYRIGDRAFENCYKLTKIENEVSKLYNDDRQDLYNVDYVGERAFYGCKLNGKIDIRRNITHIGDGAFAGSDNLEISVNEFNTHYVVSDNVLYELLNKYDENYNILSSTINKAVHAGKVPSNITLPETITEIGAYAFEGNRYLETVQFNGNPNIGDYAFAGCPLLAFVNYNISETPESVGTGVFDDCIEEFVIYVPYKAQSAFKSAFTENTDSVKSQELFMAFVNDGEIERTVTVYKGADKVEFYIPEKTGYDFDGWFDNPEYKGEPYTNGGEWQVDNGMTFYAKYTPKKCIVAFNPNGGVLSGIESITVDYDSVFSPNVTATRDGYTLLGWFDSTGRMCINAEGQCVRPWDIIEPTVLKAEWQQNYYYIKVNGLNAWLYKDGLSTEPIDITYNNALLYSINFIKYFRDWSGSFKVGQIFDYFEIYENEAINWETELKSADSGDTIVVTPIWRSERYAVILNYQFENKTGEYIATYGQSYKFPEIARTDYKLLGWYRDKDCKIPFTDILWSTDLSPNVQSDTPTISYTFYAKWQKMTYIVDYCTVGTTVASSVEYKCNTYYYLKSFTKTGHALQGWALTNGGSVTYASGARLNNLAPPEGRIKLYAVWKANEYNINFKYLMTNMYAAPSVFTYGVGLSSGSMPFVRVRGGTGRDYSLGDDFFGWYSDAACTVKVSSIPSTRTSNITLYAKYRFNTMGLEDRSTYKVTDTGVMKQPSFDVTFMLKTAYYPMTQNTNLKSIKIEISFTMWRVDNGYQYVVLYYGDKILRSYKYDMDSGKSYKRNYVYYASIEDFKDGDEFTLRFHADGVSSDDWKFNNMNINVWLTDDEPDLFKPQEK